MSVSIRPARASDAEALVRLADTLNLAVGFEADGFTPDVARRDGFGESPAFHALVAEEYGEVVGYALYTVAYETGWGARGTFLSDLYVAPSARRRGVARRLIATVARRSADHGAAYMWWLAATDNVAALSLYRSLGTREEKTVECLLDREAFAALAGLSDDGQR